MQVPLRGYRVHVFDCTSDRDTCYDRFQSRHLFVPDPIETHVSASFEAPFLGPVPIETPVSTSSVRDAFCNATAERDTCYQLQSGQSKSEQPTTQHTESTQEHAIKEAV